MARTYKLVIEEWVPLSDSEIRLKKLDTIIDRIQMGEEYMFRYLADKAKIPEAREVRKIKFQICVRDGAPDMDAWRKYLRGIQYPLIDSGLVTSAEGAIFQNSEVVLRDYQRTTIFLIEQ